MTGWRIGWACGNEQLISALAKVKSNIDSGIFSAIQVAGIAALKTVPLHLIEMCKLYAERRNCLLEGLKALKLEARKPKATFYVWIKVPRKYDSIKFSQALLERADIVVTPGVGFGKYGEGYVRIALTLPKERITEAIQRLKRIL